MSTLAFPKPLPRGPKPPRPIQRHVRLSRSGKSLRAHEEAEADKLMSRIVRVTIGRCQSCGSTDRWLLQWAHGFPRGAYPGVRFDVENAWVLCDIHHRKYTRQPEAWDRFMRSTRSVSGYAQLRERALRNARVDLGALLVSLRAEAERLGIETDEGWKAWRAGA